VIEAERVQSGPKALWSLIWGTMALFAVVSALAPGWILAGRVGIVTGVALAAAAGMHLALGDTRLSRREVTLSGIAVVLFVAGLLTERVLLLPARIDFSAYYIAGHVVTNPPGRLYNQVTFPDGRIAPLDSNTAAASSGNQSMLAQKSWEIISRSACPRRRSSAATALRLSIGRYISRP